ncbi:gamma-glutamyl-gamma-aminobutyrate hydrolase [Asanoa ishikariensis]|uniref:Putative glutamine amidotransferase n=1 Tax=Asanoa ishikariensis TaxID=137265 RepID=A0A1H3RLM1_9ACTN|nr:gamma-glutamyl-gamma-aminobutyrate hydrolase family protein [Asanoa ishikariensis]GIF67069.1 gamma-glutamyl-gamma-aminobutyrate hydrolase [Asanoa ishikariensis]SDZ26632.1 putative glutamine amidotransferase [Asanoa ishikariensis]
MSRPVIGLTTYAEEARFGLNDTFAAVLPLAYVQAVHNSGGRAVLITPDAPDVDALDGLDGIVFTGGSDVDPALYGEPAHPTTQVKPERDAAELLLLRAALAADLPTLAICRGMQLMTVAYGGKLHQHLPEVLGHDNHRPVSGPKFGFHRVDLAPGSLARGLLGESVEVNSFHHQGVADPGKLTATGWCPEDNLIEVVEDPALRFAIGVQWHPEDTTDHRLFAALVGMTSSS